MMTEIELLDTIKLIIAGISFVASGSIIAIYLYLKKGSVPIMRVIMLLVLSDMLYCFRTLIFGANWKNMFIKPLCWAQATLTTLSLTA